jgi:hypothetical protein
VNNKLLRLVEIIQENLPANLLATFKSDEVATLAERIALVSEAITLHKRHSEALWLKAGNQRTTEERRAAAQAELAGFVFACLTGDAGEHTESAMEALRALGRQGEAELVRSLSKSK